MKTMKKAAGLGAAIALAGVHAEAVALPITPATGTLNTDRWEINDNSNLTTWAAILSAFGLTDPTGLSLYYKAEVGPRQAEEGSFSTSYETEFDNEPDDPADATISLVTGQPAIDCPECFLLVKDGNQTPAQYLFDIGDWDGEDNLVLTGFWPEQGAISNVAIWGLVASDDDGDDDVPGDDDITIPEPSTVLLFGAGLLGAGLARTRRRRG